MKQLTTIAEIHAAISPEDRLFLVPTMGALHEGHIQLIKAARLLADGQCSEGVEIRRGKVVVSIFVNPIQFDRATDLDTYPRPMEQDLAICRDVGVDYVFSPADSELYFDDRSIHVSESSLSTLLCGATRPGHFDGVCTVISKLFNLFQPTAAIFGEKDYQQLAIIRRLARDLNFRTQVIGHPTVREPSGLAMSSRNLNLSDEARAQAPSIRAAFLAAEREFNDGERSSRVLLETIRSVLASDAPVSEIDYLECLCGETLQRLETVDRPAVIAIASFFGDVRLIDNITLSS